MDVVKSELGSNYTATLSERELPNWESEARMMDKVGSEFKKYLEMHECPVVEVKELRTKEDGRSTLAITIEVDSKQVELWPACNVQVFP